MKQLLFLSMLFSFLMEIQAQSEDAWIYFKDKPNAVYFLADPLKMLSQRAIDRRVKQNIPFDIHDVPIDPYYTSTIENASGISVISSSKWMNCLHVSGQFDDIESLRYLPFVLHIEYANNTLNHKKESIKTTLETKVKLETSYDFIYGNAANQISMLKGDFLHSLNYTGDGMQIAVMDAGFPAVNTMYAFTNLRNENRLLGTYNFVNRQQDVFAGNTHGTVVLSTMAGQLENLYIGTAPHAAYYLFITEDDQMEHPYEESLWVEAAERADSLGVDVLSTSLGYTTFDRPEYNYSYASMDGKTTFISRGAEIAFSRGMLVVNSAGNWGTSSWKYVGAPADAASVLSIGAVDANQIIAPFSSFGPTYDNRVKPDVAAQGVATAIINTTDQIVTASGTSFSAPVLAGTAACLWQAFPDKTNIEIANYIRKSGHIYTAPNDRYGYGIPNFEWAFKSLNQNEIAVNHVVIYPNPIKNGSMLHVYSDKWQPNTLLKMTDITGKVLEVHLVNVNDFQIQFKGYSPGIYLLHALSDTEIFTYKLILE